MFPTAGRNVLCISDVFSDCAAYEGRGGGEGEGGGIRPAVKTHIPPPKIHIHTYRHPIYTKSRTQREWGTFFQVVTYCLRILHSAHKLVLKYGIVHGLV